MQGLPPRLDLVVQSLRDSFGVKYVYCWHGLSAYWSGVAPPSYAPEAAKYQARIIYSNPPESVKEIEPSMAWNPSVVSGIGVVEDVRQLYNDMHSYLAQSGECRPFWTGPSPPRSLPVSSDKHAG